MKTTVTTFVVLCVFALGARISNAAPMRPMPTVTVVGTVVEAKWTPEKKEKAWPGASGSLGLDRTTPARFSVWLKDVDVEIIRSSGNPKWDGPSGKHKDYRLLVNSNDPDLLKPDMKIRVANYQIHGDEGGVRSTHDKVEILSAGTEAPTPKPTEGK